MADEWNDERERGSGGIHIRRNAVVVHFGSPSGTQYSVPKVKSKKKRSKKNGSK